MVENLNDVQKRQAEEARARAEGREPDYSDEHLALYNVPVAAPVGVEFHPGVVSTVTEEMVEHQFPTSPYDDEDLVEDESPVVAVIEQPPLTRYSRDSDGNLVVDENGTLDVDGNDLPVVSGE